MGKRGGDVVGEKEGRERPVCRIPPSPANTPPPKLIQITELHNLPKDMGHAHKSPGGTVK